MPIIGNELTLADLESMEPGTVFFEGTISDTPLGTGSGRVIHYVAVRGEIADWAIYASWAEDDAGYVRCHGEKVRSPAHIRRLVPCDDPAFARYRY